MWRFRSNKDRLTFLIAEFKWPLSIVLLGVGVLAVFVVEQVPNPFPAWTFTFAFGWVVAAIPMFILFLALFKSRETDDRLTVGLADPGTGDVYDAYAVDPELWAEKHVVGYEPHSPEEGFDAVVTKFEHYEDIDELEVRGVDPDLTPAGAWDSSRRVDVVYENHHVLKRQYMNFASTATDYAQRIHDAALMGVLEQQEDASLAPGVEPVELMREMEAEVEDLPDAPEPDPAPQQARAHGLEGFDGDVPEPSENESVRLEPPESGGER